MKIYTKKGDRGETGLLGGGRVAKSHARVAAYGAVDELNAVLGWALGVVQDDAVREMAGSIQPDLFAIGAHLAVSDAAARPPRGLPPLPDGRVAEFERWIDQATAELPALRAFILPGGSPGAAALHVARTVCRRAERDIVALAAEAPVAPEILVYFNRLSDLLFTLARLENRRAGVDDVEWTASAP